HGQGARCKTSAKRVSTCSIRQGAPHTSVSSARHTSRIVESDLPVSGTGEGRGPHRRVAHKHLGVKPLHVPGEALRVADGRVTEPRSQVASKDQKTVWGIRQADCQRYVVFESLAYQLSKGSGAQDGGAGS